LSQNRHFFGENIFLKIITLAPDSQTRLQDQPRRGPSREAGRAGQAGAAARGEGRRRKVEVELAGDREPTFANRQIIEIKCSM
jgi:hypothetical protein